jgi:hypothetical protein
MVGGIITTITTMLQATAAAAVLVQLGAVWAVG